MREQGGKWYKERGKWIIEFRIEFPDPMLMILDTPNLFEAVAFINLPLDTKSGSRYRYSKSH